MHRVPSAAPALGLYLPSLDGGGAERVFVQLANRFAALGARVHLVLATARGPYLREVADTVRIVDLRARGVLHSLPALVKFLRTERPLVMLSALDHANLIAILACRIAGAATRCVISMRSVPSVVYREEKNAGRHILPPLMRMGYKHADEIIANSRAVASDLIDHFRVPESKISLIYNPLDLASIERLSRQEIDSAWLGAGSSPLILGVGSLAVLKDFPTLIRAFALVRSKRACRLAILGEGPERAGLERLADDLKVRNDVRLPGFVDNPFAWMRAAKVVASSSLTEGCPNAIMQALACGSAVVSTNCVGGSSEILEDGRWGRLVPVRDPQALADAIEATLNLEQPADVRRRAADFSIDEIARSYLRRLLPGVTLPVECPR
jgi:glycosyltransferase involved in cell wall biosynthesis